MITDYTTTKRTGTAIRLILAEDDAINQQVTKKILTRFGYQVDVANNGSEAVTLLEKNDYALVLMDCMMPVLDGYDTTSIIRNQASNVRNHAIPVIALTGNAYKEYRDGCLAAGMNDFLAKPIDIADLLTMLEKWLPADASPEYAQPIVQKAVMNEYGTPSPCHDVFDRPDFVKRNLDNFVLSRSIAMVFVDSRPEYFLSICAALESQDIDGLIKASHKLKGAAANLALPLLSETVRLIESSAISGDLGKAGQLLPELEEQFNLAESAIRRWLLSPQERDSQ